MDIEEAAGRTLAVLGNCICGYCEGDGIQYTCVHRSWLQELKKTGNIRGMSEGMLLFLRDHITRHTCEHCGGKGYIFGRE